MSEPKVFPDWFLRSYLTDATDFSLEEHGACLYLLLLASREAGLRAGPERLERMFRVMGSDYGKIWPQISQFFEEEDGWLAPSAQLKRARNDASTIARKRRMESARVLGRHTEEQWSALVVEFEGRCLKCGRADRAVHKDHIVPVSAGGSDDISNLQPLCKPCNSSKGRTTENFVVLRRREGFGCS